MFYSCLEKQTAQLDGPNLAGIIPGKYLYKWYWFSIERG